MKSATKAPTTDGWGRRASWVFVGLLLATAVGCDCESKSKSAAADAAVTSDGAVERLSAWAKGAAVPTARRPLPVPGVANEGDPGGREAVKALMRAVDTFGAVRQPSSSMTEASAVADAVLQAAATTDGVLTASSVTPAQLGLIGRAVSETAQAQLAADPGKACWLGLAAAAVGLSVKPALRTVAGEALVQPGLALCRSVAARAARGELAVEAVDALQTGCRSLNDRPQGFLLDAQVAAVDDAQEVVTALTAGAEGPVAGTVGRLGGPDAYLKARQAELRWLEQWVSGGELPAAPAAMEQLQAERRRLWTEAGESRSVLSPQSYARWAFEAATVRATCLTLAVGRTQAANRGQFPAELPKGDAALLVDPLGAAPWEFVPDGLGGRLLRSGPVEIEGRPLRVELGLDGPPPAGAPKRPTGAQKPKH